MRYGRVLGAVALATVLGGATVTSAEVTEAPPADRQAMVQQRVESGLADAQPIGTTTPAPAVAAESRSADASAAALDPASLCYNTAYPDPDEALDALLDGTTYGLSFDCTTSEWVLSVETTDSWSLADLAWVDIAIDTDRNFATGCGGGEYYLVVGSAGPDMVGDLYRTPDAYCETFTRVANSRISYERSGPDPTTDISIAFNSAPFRGVASMRWQSTITHVDASDPIDYMPDGWLGAGNHRTAPVNPCGGRCFYLTNATTGGPAEVVFKDDHVADEVLTGDWNADGIDTFGFRKGNAYALKDVHASDPIAQTFGYGRATDVVLVGDWDGDGIDTLAVRRGGTYYFKNSFGSGAADVTVVYGRPTDAVLVGDWNGDGIDTLAVRRGGTYYFKNSFTGGAADITVVYGRPTDATFAGDWDGDGVDTLLVRRNATYYMKNSFTGGAADITFNYGLTTDATLIGDWNADGRETVSVRR